MDRAHVDDAAAAAPRIHVAQHGARRQKGAIEVDRQKLLPFGERKILKRGNGLNSGVADQHVDPSKRRNRFRDAGLDLRFVGHVHGDAYGAR